MYLDPAELEVGRSDRSLEGVAVYAHVRDGRQHKFRHTICHQPVVTGWEVRGFSSDWGCTLGSTAGAEESLCGPPWVAGTTYSAGQMINPFGATTGSGTNYGVYQVTTGGIASTTKPAWFVLQLDHCGKRADGF